MEIVMTVEEYFNELKLMEEQYGREEDIYPWIYMMLKMSENKCKGLSLRDVHNLKRPRNEEHKIEMFLRQGVGAPDFAYVSNGEVVGCVEIKAGSFHKNFQRNGEIKFSVKAKKKYEVGRKNKINVEEWIYNKVPSLKIEKPNQLLGHLEKYRKVIFTNGKVFYFFALISTNGENMSAKILELANFEETYNDFIDKGRYDNNANEEWKKLKQCINKIKWSDTNEKVIKELEAILNKHTNDKE